MQVFQVFFAVDCYLNRICHLILAFLAESFDDFLGILRLASRHAHKVLIRLFSGHWEFVYFFFYFRVAHTRHIWLHFHLSGVLRAGRVGGLQLRLLQFQVAALFQKEITLVHHTAIEVLNVECSAVHVTYFAIETRIIFR